MFKPVNNKVSFPHLEENILSFWKEHQIFQKSVDARKGSTKFSFYEGPPTANGNPGIHHVLSRIFKDVIPRYRNMKGYYTPRKAGWDTHGLPVELEIEKKLGFSSKNEIENYGIAKFNALCKESVFNYLKEWNAMTERIGFWLDLEHPYITLDNSYIESCWWVIKQLWDQGLVYQGYRVTPHCPRCGTSLSSHEVALGYDEHAEDPSVYIKFRLAVNSLKKSNLSEERAQKLQSLMSDKPVYFLAWTTTPWTLPGNTALAVSADSEYLVMDIGSEYIIMAKALVDSVMTDDYKIIDKVFGSDLVNASYEPLFNPHHYGIERSRYTNQSSGSDDTRTGFTIQDKDDGLTYHIITANFVSMDDGTGIVHIAPAFGEADFEAGKSNRLDFVQPVDLDGRITGKYPFAGKFVKDADPLVLDDLRTRGLLYRSETIIHTYPFCWRCDSPLLYYAKRTWYVRTTARKDELIAGNKKINWYPEHIKYGRFGDWLENNIDWAFSRERYWGTPLSIWRCSVCGTYECIGSLEELKKKPGLKGMIEPLDLHRPYVDEITFNCPSCGKEMNRQPEVIDCWFDSGAMPIAQWHYPFENKAVFDMSFPADFICEAVDQTRGWFYSLHALAIMLFSQQAFKNVICLGHILDAQGEKMSKARGNVVDPWTILNQYGADAIRWYLYISSPPGNARRFSSDIVAEVQRNFFLTLWNTYSFFVTYANIDQFSPENNATGDLSDLDKWLKSSLNQLIVDVDEALDKYDPTSAARKIESFVSDLSNWYIRRSRRRFWKSQNDEDKLSAYHTLYNCLVTLSKLLAPFAPFIAEEMYRNLVLSFYSDAPQSVHMTDFPVADTGFIDKKLIDATSLTMTVCSLGRAARAKAAIKVRQPLARALIKVSSKSGQEGLSRFEEQVLEELNVKTIEFVDSEIDDEARFAASKDGDVWVAVDKELTPELKIEGAARELVRRLQTMRRAAGLEITDHITVYFEDSSAMKDVIASFGDYIKQETLARELVAGTISEEAYSDKFRLMDAQVRFGLKKIA